MIKDWILKTFFQKILEEATRQGSIDAFVKAHADLKETLVENIEDRADELSQKKLQELLSVIDESQVVALDSKKGLIYLGGVLADEGKLVNLKAEAEFLVNSEIWKIINHTIRELAQRSMFVQGESLDDLKKGRSMLFLLDSQNNIVKILKSYTQRK